LAFFGGLLFGFGFLIPTNLVSAQELNPNPPERPVKLIFIHHSTGENWLKDGYGNLGRTLGAIIILSVTLLWVGAK
jgi:hypothetical protein